MDKRKLKAARRAGFIYGLFRAAPIPTEILPKNLAKEAFEQMDEKAPSSLAEMRRTLKAEMGLDAVGFIPTRDRRGVQMIHQPYAKPRRDNDEEFPEIRNEDDDELVIQPGEDDELEIEMEDPSDLVVDIDEDLKARGRYDKARRRYLKEQRKKKKASASSDVQRLSDMFARSNVVEYQEPFEKKKKKSKK